MTECSICSAPIEGQGHDPDPLGDPKKDRCCDWCREHLVIPAQERRKEVARWKEEVRG